MTQIHINLDVVLVSPYGDSLLLLETLCSLWKIRTLKTDTNSDKCKISLNWKTFKKFFHKNPQINEELVIPKQLISFIRKMKVTKIEIVDI